MQHFCCKNNAKTGSQKKKKKLFKEFPCDYKSTTDAESTGRPTEITTEEMVNKISDIV